MPVKYETVKVLNERRNRKLHMDETLVLMGGSRGSESVKLCMLHIWGEKLDTVLLTNVLDRKVLPPLEIGAFYRRRWTIERMYLAIKDVLDLNCLFNCSPEAVGQKVYATATLYNGLRLSQIKIAFHAGMPPVDLSKQRLFSVLIENLIKATYRQAGVILYHSKMSKNHLDLADDDPLITSILTTRRYRFGMTNSWWRNALRSDENDGSVRGDAATRPSGRCQGPKNTSKFNLAVVP